MKYVIIEGDTFWMAPKGESGQWNCNRWTRDITEAFGYKDEKAAVRALRRLQALKSISENATVKATETTKKWNELGVGDLVILPGRCNPVRITALQGQRITGIQRNGIGVIGHYATVEMYVDGSVC